jgi:hypothetical protein
MAFGLASVSAFLKLLWLDKMDVTIAEEVQQGSAINHVFPATPQLVDIPCRISFGRKDQPVDITDDSNPTDIAATIFCDKSTDIPNGSRIAIRRFTEGGIQYMEYSSETIKIAKATKYESHQEILVTINGDA